MQLLAHLIAAGSKSTAAGGVQPKRCGRWAAAHRGAAKGCQHGRWGRGGSHLDVLQLGDAAAELLVACHVSRRNGGRRRRWRRRRCYRHGCWRRRGQHDGNRRRGQRRSSGRRRRSGRWCGLAGEAGQVVPDLASLQHQTQKQIKTSSSMLLRTFLYRSHLPCWHGLLPVPLCTQSASLRRCRLRLHPTPVRTQPVPLT